VQVKKIAIYGVGGFGREIAWLIESCSSQSVTYEIVCFIDDNQLLHGKVVNEIPVIGIDEAGKNFPGCGVVGGVGDPKLRQRLMEKAFAVGFESEVIIHPRVERSKWIEIGEGTVICAGNILTTNISLGRQVQINLDCTIGHDVIMSDYTTLAPGVHVSGYVHFGQRVYVGTGATIINGTQEQPIVIGDDSIIGAGACVTKSVPPGLTVVGVPAKPVSRQVV